MTEVVINIPASFEEERRYIVKTLFEEFAGVVVDINVHGDNGYVINGNGRSFEVVDDFFRHVPDNETYLKAELLPKTAMFFDGENAENTLPILYGSDQIDRNDGIPVVHFDVFASAFFMLTRWEETLSAELDNHERFKGVGSVAYKWGFHDRPVVNYYGKLLRNWIREFLGLEVQNTRSPRIILTHDVDSPRLWTSFKALLQQQFLAVFKYHAVGQYFRNYGSYLRGADKDPWNTFDLLMAQAESLNVPAHFYFIPDGSLKHETHYRLSDQFILDLIARIKQRGHVIGIHPSYYTLGKPEMLGEQKEMLEQVAGITVTTGRQHYLRFKAPDTWRHWDQVGLQRDSSVYYADIGGYRCGACSEFSLFDVVERRPFKLKELPLTMMEQTYVAYTGVSPEEMKKDLKRRMEEVKELRGDFVSLWHNSSFYTSEFRKYESVQAWMIETLKRIF